MDGNQIFAFSIIAMMTGMYRHMRDVGISMCLKYVGLGKKNLSHSLNSSGRCR
jgi:hypothetical protein